MTNSAQNRDSLAEDDAERKLGGSAEAPPHKKLRGIGLPTCPTTLGSPQDAHGVLFNFWIRCKNRHPMYDGLRHQHPIEGIRVETRQPAGMEGGFLINVKGHNSTCFAYLRHKNVRPCRKGKAPDSVLDPDFPSGGGAQVALVVAIQKDSSSGPAQPGGFRSDPEKCTGVEENLHEKKVTCR
jgi:hypothetical protein